MLIEVYKNFEENIPEYIDIKDIKKYFTVVNPNNRLNVLVETYDNNKYEIAYNIVPGCYNFLIFKISKIIKQDELTLLNCEDITSLYENNIMESFWFNDNAFGDLYEEYQELIDKIGDILIGTDKELSTNYEFNKYMRKNLSDEEIKLYYNELVKYYKEQIQQIDPDLAKYIV